MRDRRDVIIGNSAAAVGCIAGIRKSDSTTPITLIARECEHTYARPLISYLLAGKVDERGMDYRDRGFYERNGVETILGVAVTLIDETERYVETDDGRRIAFGKLLIATGGKPVIPAGLPGTDAKGVFTFTTWEDARRIMAHIGEATVQHAVVIGGGLIGLKAVEALVELGIKTTVVELADRILSTTFDRTASDMALRFLEKRGVHVHCSTTVSDVTCVDGRVVSAKLENGKELVCDLLIYAIGVVPDVSVAAGTGIATDRGILTDAHMQTSVPGIYAAGDVVQGIDLLTGESRTIPILPNATRQGVVAGVNMAGGEMTYAGGIAMNAVDIAGLPTISVGITSSERADDEVLATSDESAGTYKKLVLRDNRIVGAIFVGDIDRAGIVTGLIKGKVDVSAFKELLLSRDFGIISLPLEYRKHIVSGVGIEV